MSDHPQQEQEGTLHGTVLPVTTQKEKEAAFDQAFDYRGDVAIYTDDGSVIEGYVFDRRRDVPKPYLRLIHTDGDQRVVVPYHRIVRLEFTGKDAAAGKSWQSWVKKHQQKKTHGEKASLESQPL